MGKKCDWSTKISSRTIMCTSTRAFETGPGVPMVQAKPEVRSASTSSAWPLAGINPS